MESMPVVGSATSYRFFSDDDLKSAPRAAPRTAVLIVHGIGQQRKFETLSNVIDGLERVAAGIAGPPTARNVAVGDQRLSRMELELDDQRQVDIYEAYWSPITEGQVTLRDVMNFLIQAAWSGIRNAGKTFRRWMFRGHQEFEGGRRTKTLLMLAASVLVSLVFLNGLILTLGAMKAAGGGPSWLKSAAVLNDLTAIVLVLLAVIGGFGFLYLAARRQKAVPNGVPFVSRWGLRYLVAVTACTVIAAAASALAIGYHRDVFWGTAGRFAGAALTWLGAFLLFAAAILCLVAIARSRAKALDLLDAILALGLAVSVVLIAANRGAAAIVEEGLRVPEPSIFEWIPAWETIPAWWSAGVAFALERWVMIWAALAFVSTRVRGFLVQ